GEGLARLPFLRLRGKGPGDRGKKYITRSKPKAFFINVSGPELLTKWVGETEHKIRKLFEKARRSSGPYTPVIIFFDEIESMFQTRGSGISSDVEKTIVPQFLAELDGVRELRNVLVIGASNRVELIDPALLRPGRLDRKIKIDRPNNDAAVEILLKYLLPDLPTTGDVSTLARQLIEILYDERSYIQVTQKRGERLILPARQFASGAILESVVTRAKKAAAELWILEIGLTQDSAEGPPTGDIGRISLDTLKEALNQEYEENKEHFVVNLLEFQDTDYRRPSIDDITVSVRWATQVEDRWNDTPPDMF
ncbi:MAG: AAA family ATPase, partial [Anaerolineales bacterium]|nr:AAA family ATPase [Anaerolineales bacterium]